MARQAFTIFGLPGSGKSIQAEALEKTFNLKYISTGDLSRKAAKKDEEIKEKIDSGKILSAQIIINLIKSKLKNCDLKNGIIFDNFPFNQKQLDLFNKELKKDFNLTSLAGIYLEITPETALNRIASRKICSNCNKIFKPNDKGHKKGKCPDCNKKLTVRDDDKPKVVKKRIKKYQKQVSFLKKYFTGQNRLIEINGEPSIKNIKESIKQKLTENFNLDSDE